MAGPKKKSESPAHGVRLYLGPSFEGAWQKVILPWFRSVGLTAAAALQPTLVVVPYFSRAQFLRGLSIEAGIPLLGVTFVSPSELRELLLSSEKITLPLREHLRLLLSVSAEQETRHEQAPEAEAIAAKSVWRSPDYLLRTIDELSAAGWSFGEAGPASFQKLVARFGRLASRCGFTSIQEADRVAFRKAQNGEKLFAQVLVTGFDAAHWALWPLLAAAVRSADRATVILSDPRDEARDLDECWVGTWEQSFGAAEPIEAPAAFATTDQAPQLELFAEQPPRPVHFLLGQETTEEANAIVTLVLQFLSDPKLHRLGVLFPGAGALARTVATQLASHKIPHYDSIGHLVAPTLEDLSWLAWLELQENNRLYPLLNFLATLDDRAAIFSKISREEIDDVLRRTFTHLLIDDVAVLRTHCAEHSDVKNAALVASNLETIQLLPAAATFSEFVTQTQKIFEQLKWKNRGVELERLSESWKAGVDFPFARENYLRWLGEILGKPKRSRDPMGDHPYSRVQLLPLSAAEGEAWSHLILAGLNEGAWPPAVNESDFVRDTEIDALNQRIRILNQRVVVQGRQGEGQWSVKPGNTLCLGARERRLLALRQIANVLESAGHGLGVTASLFTESVPRRIANPSEFFTQLYYQRHGKPLSETTLEALQLETRSWIEHAGLFRETIEPDDAVRQTRIAFDVRRAEAEAGEYEFSLREPLAQPISFSASQTERLFKTPALIWMKSFLGVEANGEDTEQWNLATGNWVHHWLRQIVDAPAPESFAHLETDFPARIPQAAWRFREEVAALLQKFQRPLPDWWISTWQFAVYLANAFVTRVAQAEAWRQAGTEWSLRELPVIPVIGGEGLKLRGRIDLILAQSAPAQGRFDGLPLWVVDYKTGKRKSLRPPAGKSEEETLEFVLKQFLRGDGIQVALYALALQQLGAEDVGVSLLAPGLDLAEPQLNLRQITAHPKIWRELAQMQRTGVFGMRGLIRSEFAFTGDYPLATLPIDKDLLETKWILTHQAFAADDGGEDEA
ncbi:MAG TPA: PD-(D/E)XK nuclease family protein [Chthoniobacterales bacterium]